VKGRYVLDRIFIEGTVVMYDMGHGGVVLFGNYLSFSGKLALVWLDMSSEEMFFQEVNRTIEEFFWKCE